MTWAISLTYELDLDFKAFEELADTLDKIDASVFNLREGRIVVTWWTEAPSAVKASMLGAERVGNIVHLEPVAIEALTIDDYEHQADEPTLPHLVSAPEIGDMLGGISRQRVHQLRALNSFPAPLVELRTGPIWDAEAIERFAREWTRKPGRPARPEPDVVLEDRTTLDVKVYKTKADATRAAKQMARKLANVKVTISKLNDRGYIVKTRSGADVDSAESTSR